MTGWTGRPEREWGGGGEEKQQKIKTVGGVSAQNVLPFMCDNKVTLLHRKYDDY